MPKQAAEDSGPSPRDILARARAAVDVAALLGILRADALPKKDLRVAVIAAVLNVLATKADGSHDPALNEGVLEVAEVFIKRAAVQNQGTPPEAAVTVMTRLCFQCGRPQRALALVAESRAAGTKPKLRTISCMLAQASAAGDVETCFGVWAQIRDLGMDPQDAEFAAMLRGLKAAPERQMEVLEQLLEDLPQPSDPPLIEELGRVFGVEGVADTIGQDGQHPVGGSRWRSGWSAVSPEGLCSLTGRQLSAVNMPPAEARKLLRFVSRLAHESCINRGFHKFQRWLRRVDPFDVIIDGANVGFNSQNFEGGHFQYSQVELVVDHFRQKGVRILLVLHPKWLREDVNLSTARKKKRRHDQLSKDTLDLDVDLDKEYDSVDDDTDVVYPCEGVTEAERQAEPGTHLALLRRWKEEGIVASCAPYDCDDWYWLYAALDSMCRGKAEVQAVSNDLMRDHQWRMEGQRGLAIWQDRHVTRYAVMRDLPEGGGPEKVELNLFPPKPFSLRAQASEDRRAWHFPVLQIRSRAEQLQSGRPVGATEKGAAQHRWLAAWLPEAEGGPPQGG